jgi:hypothetical protein
VSFIVVLVYVGGMLRGFEAKKGWVESLAWPYELGRYLFDLCHHTAQENER